MAWGVVSVLAGAALLASMLTFDVREISWNYLNKSGEVMEGTTNLLNVVGLYGAGIVYWVLGEWPGCWRFAGLVGILPFYPRTLAWCDLWWRLSAGERVSVSDCRHYGAEW
ncbi:MAG: hypothetical protein ACLSUW_09540 [Akkermansia sp.]